MPMMVVPAVAGYMFFMLFQSGGPVNDILSRLTGYPVTIAWLSDPTLALFAVMVADIWQWTPLMFLILLAGLVGVPEDQIKAATLLGANAWQRFTTIVLPKMKTIIIIALAIRRDRELQDLRHALHHDRRRPRRRHRDDLRLHLQGHHPGPDLGLCRGDRARHPGRAVDRRRLRHEAHGGGQARRAA